MSEYLNLKAEMIRRRLTTADFASSLGISERAVCAKIKGDSDFYWSQAKKLRETFFEGVDMLTLFARDEQDSA
ncbi:hypothetical protein FACS1894217_05280 [Clostridia bacterium]|nr:hypothetical protein FACS1894217_05280 [Clostridia bacterium]